MTLRGRVNDPAAHSVIVYDGDGDAQCRASTRRAFHSAHRLPTHVQPSRYVISPSRMFTSYRNGPILVTTASGDDSGWNV